MLFFALFEKQKAKFEELTAIIKESVQTMKCMKIYANEDDLIDSNVISKESDGAKKSDL